MIININTINNKNYTLSASFLSVIDYLEKDLKDFVWNSYIKLLDIIYLKNKEREEVWDIVLTLWYNWYLNIYKSKKNKKSNWFKSFISIKDKRFSYSYLMWYFSQEVVKNYVRVFSKSNTLSRIKLRDFIEILVPIPKENLALDLKQREVIEEYYMEYNSTYREWNIISSIALAWWIIETLLVSILLNNWVSKAILEKKMIGQLLEFTEILKVFENQYYLSNWKKENILELFRNVQKARNKIHSWVLRKDIWKSKNEILEWLKNFDKIILYYGL